jgi:hypothetical protein
LFLARSLRSARLIKGRRFGELLLKTLFEFGRANSYDAFFLTIFERHEQLVDLLQAFGFAAIQGPAATGEVILAKRLNPTIGTAARGLSYNVEFGPFHVDWSQPGVVIPIQPRYHGILFPEQESHQQLFGGTLPFGNALRKAYLCNSKLKGLAEGSVLWFYRSQNDRGIVASGVLEAWMRSQGAGEIAQFVGKRTVYSYDEIEELASREVLAINFRQARLLLEPVRLQDLVAAGVLRGAPQSIVRLGESEWLSNRIQ